MKVVITDHEFGDVIEERRIANESNASFEVYDDVKDPAEVARITQGADVVLLCYAQITEEVLKGLAPNATVIRYGMGYDTIDADAATRLGVRVCNVPDYGADTVADHTVMLALASIRRLQAYDSALKASDDGWIPAPEIGKIPAMSDVTFGLLGIGQIGRKVASRVQAFGARVIAYDPYVSQDALEGTNITLADLDEFLAESDAISLHAPLFPSTHHIINAEAIARMKNSAVLINTARGPLIDTEAAIQAIEENRLGGLALDVFETEPLEAGSKLRQLDRVLLTPHAAYYSERSLANLQLFAAEEMGRALKGEALRCQVNR
ncbi:hypothetical protein HMPREF2736_02785 [Corynebacterium sp. HMSC036E10]|uniref:C-terminal binding protein n=1 Tax=Corynebacterium sp. HMSC036E10 TaxID=1715215 RepID=UPI0008AA56C5|nr:C-terminal binding protein [Corynebacterium sp. HMSC036E10]OHO83337.1 hypothetical protein HMPREF2736_02785 [Corynebacterium sp. HMSC036E10]